MDRLLELTSQAEESHFWFRGFRQFVTPLLDRAAAGRRDLLILDCGSGTGYNLRQLSAYGRAFGLDLSAAGLAMARLAGRSVVQADATRLPYPSGRFDLVTSFDALQCIPDDAAAMDEMSRVLKRGGHLVGTVAALEILHGDHSVLSEEVRRYRRDEVVERIRTAGLEPLLVQFAFASLFPMLLAVRVVQEYDRGVIFRLGRFVGIKRQQPLIESGRRRQRVLIAQHGVEKGELGHIPAHDRKAHR